MADDDKYEDEYQFSDPDAAAGESADYNLDAGDNTKPVSEKPATTDNSFARKRNVIRNALIAVVALIVILAIYPFIYSAGSTEKKMKTVVAIKKTRKAVVPRTAIPAVPVASPVPVASTVSYPSQDDNQINQKLSSLESNQERMQTDFTATTTQLSAMSVNINDMMAKVTALNDTITRYAAKIDEQSHVIEQLTAQKQKVAIKKVSPSRMISKQATPPLKYFIQAAIPGRAWLIATNGSTLTVREGTVIAGLGMVTLIDPRQGRVLTSSGYTIRFSPADS